MSGRLRCFCELIRRTRRNEREAGATPPNSMKRSANSGIAQRFRPLGRPLQAKGDVPLGVRLGPGSVMQGRLRPFSH